MVATEARNLMQEDNIKQTPQNLNNTPSQPAPVTPQPAPSTAQQTNATTPLEDPGKTTGVIALILAFFMPLLALIIGIIARSTSKKAGFKNTPAFVAIILSSVFMALAVIGLLLVIVFGATAISQLKEKCKDLGPGVHYEGNTVITCNADGSVSSSSSSTINYDTAPKGQNGN